MARASALETNVVKGRTGVGRGSIGVLKVNRFASVFINQSPERYPIAGFIRADDDKKHFSHRCEDVHHP
jgi:hypothetical protein